MKASMIIALPALALAAASPVQVEERQLPGVPGVPGVPSVPGLPGLPTLDTTCIGQISGLTACASLTPNLQDPAFVFQLLTCPVQIILKVVGCIIPKPL